MSPIIGPRTWFLVSITLLVVLPHLIAALRLPATAQERSTIGRSIASGLSFKQTSVATNSDPGPDDLNVTNIQDALYFTTIELGGQEVVVQLDTGSSDLWVYLPNSNISTTNTTDLPAEVEYGRGGVSGNIDFAELTLGTYHVNSQAFINVNNASDLDSLFDNGINGLIGLSFDFSSLVDQTIRFYYDNSSTLGQTPLSNIFSQNTSIANIMTVLLGRAYDTDGVTTGIFTIGEYEPGYEAVQNATKLQRENLTPNMPRWAVVLSGIQVNQQQVPLTSKLEGAQQNTSIVMLDTGYSFPPVPFEVAAAIYGQFDGAVEATPPGIYIVPCTGYANVTFTFADQAVPVHPLDLTSVSSMTLPNGTNVTYCRNTYVGQNLTASGFPDLDMILGDALLKNVYASFDFGQVDTYGNITEDPFIQLLSITNFSTAIPEFFQVRQQILANSAPELPPSDLVNIVSEGE